ncbi:MAG TPA: M24 family metallopeptidase [Bryobacteraceae bacterium]|nr:M24 family metallopeptidase [Bryobacteraceae bacterium]
METLLTRDGCLRRQERLRTEMQVRRWDLFLTGHARTIYYLTGTLVAPESPAALVIRRDGGTVLLSPATEAPAADECVTVETYSISRLISDPHSDMARLLTDRIDSNGGRTCAVELSHTPACYVQHLASAYLLDAGPALRSLRKSKNEDEIAEIRRSLALSAVAYDAARSAIRPGLTEIDIYNAMFEAATKHATETFTFAGDFACGLRCVQGGGPPTGNKIQSGDLYILDLFPSCAFYYGDTCRTFVVGEPSPAQQKAWESVAGAFGMAEKAAAWIACP